jgi:5-methylcytosine-specific restriction enzyme subunit McrC
MEKLFEEFIAEMIRTNKDIIPENVRGRIYVQKSVGHLATKNGSKYFELIPDVVLEGEEKAIIDTKYKLLNEEERNYGVSQQDLYQMYVYCKEVGAKKCLLIYPEVHNGRIESHWELGRDKIKLYVRTVSLAHDLTTKEGKEAFVEDLKRVLSCLA